MPFSPNPLCTTWATSWFEVKTQLENMREPFLSYREYREICSRLDANRVLIPDLLAAEECRFDFDYNSALKFIIGYDFLPLSVMPRFIVRMHRDIKDHRMGAAAG